MLMLLPILQAIAAAFTIFGFFNVPHVTDTVITYGMSGEDAPNWAQWFNSYGSAAFGLASLVGTQLLKSKLGLNGPLYIAVIGVLKSPSDKVAALNLFLAVLDVVTRHFVSPTDTNDLAAIAYMREWITSKFVAHLTPPITKS